MTDLQNKLKTRAHRLIIATWLVFFAYGVMSPASQLFTDGPETSKASWINHESASSQNWFAEEVAEDSDDKHGSDRFMPDAQMPEFSTPYCDVLPGGFTPHAEIINSSEGIKLLLIGRLSI